MVIIGTDQHTHKSITITCDRYNAKRNCFFLQCALKKHASPSFCVSSLKVGAPGSDVTWYTAVHMHVFYFKLKPRDISMYFRGIMRLPRSALLLFTPVVRHRHRTS
jgi:hypothetical protein